MTASAISDRERRVRRVRRKRRAAAGLLTLLLVVASYCALTAAAPLPELHARLTAPSHVQLTADSAPAQAAVDAQQLPTAAGWFDQQQVWANTSDRFRIASLTKLITVLVSLEQAPVAAGSDGPTHTLSEADAALVEQVIAQNGSFAPAPAGLQLTTRQVLDLILVPSANNYAISYSRWIFGSDEAFLVAANDWLTRNGLSNVHIEEAAGLSDNNVASPADMVRIARLALANPLIASIVSQTHISIPGVGDITTTNRLLGEQGVIGLKTGTTFPNGYNLAAAKREDIGGHTHIAIAVTLERADGEARANDTRAVLDAMGASGQNVSLSTQGERVGVIRTWAGANVALVAETSETETLVPGESASREVILSLPDSGLRGIKRGTEIGEIAGVAPNGRHRTPIITSAPIREPDFIWRVMHPRDLLEWYGVLQPAKR